MTIVCLEVFLLLFVYPLAAHTEDERSSFFSVRRNAAFWGNDGILRSEKTAGLMSCARLCSKEALCSVANFDEKRQLCLLVKESPDDKSGKHWKEQKDFSGLEKVNLNPNKHGTTKETSVLNCKQLLQMNPTSTSGVYWIDPDGGLHDNAFKVYCDQVTDGGGWTLVWSYHFTNYSNFKSRSNAITPRPNWQLRKKTDVNISTTVPLSETQYDAMNFSLWTNIGSDVLIKSNINNWITCKPGNGSLVEWVAGSMACHLVKEVNPKCRGTVPDKLEMKSRGPALFYSSMYYYFDGYKGSHWPTHDPCGTNTPNQLEGVENPHGNIYIR